MSLIRMKVCSIIIVVILFVAFIGAFLKISAYYGFTTYISGKVIFIDCGHGGKDNGASVNGVMEDYINMKIGGHLFEKLVNAGAYVLMSRTGDYDLSSMYIKNKKSEDLKNRVKYINISKPDLFISIHLNMYSSQNVRGAQVFCQNNEKSKLISDYVQSELNILTGINKKNKIGDYYILNKSKHPGVLVECGFLSNPEERKKLQNDEYQEKIATTLMKGIVNYFSS